MLVGCGGIGKTNRGQTASYSCGGVAIGSTKTQQCPDGQKGTVLQVCSDKGWGEQLNTCEAIPPACADKTSFVRDVKPIIDAKCASCHVSPRNYADFDVAKGTIDAFITRINLPSADSRRMPKTPKAELSAAEKALFEKWKSDGLSETGECPIGEGGVSSLDYLETLMLNDLNKIDGAGRANTRYLIMGGRLPGSSSGDVKLFTQGVNKAVNSISSDRDLALVSALDTWGTVYRMDLRSYGLSGADWNIVIGADKFKFISNTSKGQQIKALSGTSQPWLHADNFVFTALDAPQYNQLTRVPASRSAFFQKIGVDFQGSFDDFEALLIGFFGSPISENKNRLLSRHDSSDGYLWATYDPAAVAGGNRNLFQDPLLPETRGRDLFQFDASEMIYTLPNGLQGYALFNAAGVRQDAAPLNVVFDTDTPFNNEIRNGISCSRCHAAGLIPAQDQIRQHVLANASEFDRTDVELVKAYFRGAAAGDASIAQDNKTFGEGLDGIGLNNQKPDAVNFLTDNFRRDWTLKDCAGFVFMSETEFKEALNGSAQGKSQIGQLLTGGTVSQQQFINTFPILIRDLRLGLDPIDK
jgi:hypothetical protein